MGAAVHCVCARTDAPRQQWRACGVPLVGMMNIEHRRGTPKPVIRKALVELAAEPFAALAAVRDHWRVADHYRAPGPIQFDGVTAHAITFTLRSTAESIVPLVTRAVQLAAAAAAEAGSTATGGYDSSVDDMSELQLQQLAYTPPLPGALAAAAVSVTPQQGLLQLPDTQSLSTQLPHLAAASSVLLDCDAGATSTTAPQPPLRVGVVFCGRQCPGGHNVIMGLYDHLQQRRPGSVLLGFLGGTKGEPAVLFCFAVFAFSSLLCNKGCLMGM